MCSMISKWNVVYFSRFIPRKLSIFFVIYFRRIQWLENVQKHKQRSFSGNANMVSQRNKNKRRFTVPIPILITLYLSFLFFIALFFFFRIEYIQVYRYTQCFLKYLSTLYHLTEIRVKLIKHYFLNILKNI